MTGPDLARLAAAYARDGFVAVEGLLAAEEVEALKAEAFDIATGRRGRIAGAAPQGERTPDEVAAGVLAIHFPHKVSPSMRAVMRHPRIVEVLTRLIGPDVKAMQSILFVKAAGQPGQAWHQDETYIPTRDRSLCGVWIALDNATVENGCLWFQPGSHRSGVLWPMRPHDDARFDASEQAYGHPYDADGGVAAEVKAGAAVFFNGHVLHRSLPNRAAAGYRRALVTHYMSARSLLPWSLGAPPVPREDYRDIELVAGEDPYAWKGVCDESRPFVRPPDGPPKR
jgi:ectoine hydroxylase-related dioxygenase (phytanoyl-CoA dioxygenase family)